MAAELRRGKVVCIGSVGNGILIGTIKIPRRRDGQWERC
jgi:hypothetical protein